MKKIIAIIILTVVAVAIYMGVSMLRLEYNNTILDMLINPGIWALISTICCFRLMRRENKVKVEKN